MTILGLPTWLPLEASLEYSADHLGNENENSLWVAAAFSHRLFVAVPNNLDHLTIWDDVEIQSSISRKCSGGSCNGSRILSRPWRLYQWSSPDGEEQAS